MEIHNDMLRFDGLACRQVGDMMLGEIDFDWIVERYFLGIAM